MLAINQTDRQTDPRQLHLVRKASAKHFLGGGGGIFMISVSLLDLAEPSVTFTSDFFFVSEKVPTDFHLPVPWQVVSDGGL